MHRTLGIISSLAAILGFLLLLNMFWASVNNGGMAVLGLQVFVISASVAAIILGGLGLLLGRPSPSGFSNFGFGVGLGNLVALAIAYLLF